MMISNFNIFGANQIFCDLRNDYLSEAFLHHAFHSAEALGIERVTVFEPPDGANSHSLRTSYNLL